MKTNLFIISIVVMICIGFAGLMLTRIDYSQNKADIIIQKVIPSITEKIKPYAEPFPVLNNGLSKGGDQGFTDAEEDSSDPTLFPTPRKKMKPFPPPIMQLKYPGMMDLIKKRESS